MKDFHNNEFSTEQLYILMNKLIAAKIPFEVEEYLDTPHIMYPSSEQRICSVICHSYSYGHERGLLEIMGLVEREGDDVEGCLTATEVFNRIKKHYEEKGK